MDGSNAFRFARGIPARESSERVPRIIRILLPPLPAYGNTGIASSRYQDSRCPLVTARKNGC